MKYYTLKNNEHMEVVDVDTICNSIKELVDSANRRAEAAINELKEMRDEKWKDNELQDMKEQLESAKRDLLRGFPISERESKKIAEWKDQHYTNQHNAPDNKSRIQMQGVSGGLFSYIFLPTSIATFGTCRCNACYRKALDEAGKPSDYQKLGFYQERIKKLVNKYDAEFEFQAD